MSRFMETPRSIFPHSLHTILELSTMLRPVCGQHRGKLDCHYRCHPGTILVAHLACFEHPGGSDFA